MKALVDLTAAVPGTVPNLLQQISSGSVGNHSLTLLCYVGQLGVQRALVGTAKLVEVPAECNLIEEVKSWIANPEHGDSDLIVCSFRPEVWALQYVPVLGGLSRKVEFPTWRPFLSLILGVTGSSLYPVSAGSGAWPEGLMPLSEALEKLRLALAKRGGSAHQTQLRGLLKEQDDRFSKSNPIAAMPRLVSTLMNLAKDAGLIKIVGESQGGQLIQLISAAPEAKTLPKHQGEQILPHLPNPGNRVMEARNGTGTDLYTSVFESQKMGPFANLRGHFFDSMERALTDKLSVEHLISRCLRETKAAYVKSGGSEKNLPWATVRRFFETLLCRRPVFLNVSGESIYPSFAHAQTVAVRLADDWRLELEGELILFLLEKGQKIEYADVPALTGAMCMTRDDEDRERVIKLIDHLRTTNRIAFGQSGITLTS